MKTQIQRFTGWQRLRRGINGFQQGLLVGLAAVLVINLAVILTGLGVRFGIGRDEFMLFNLASTLVVSVSFGLAAYFWPISAIKVARFFDHEFNLKDRTSTALEIVTMYLPDNDSGKELQKLQVEDALKHAKRITPPANFFIHIPTRSILLAAVLVLGIMTTNYFAKPYFIQVSARQALQQAIQPEIISLEELQQAVRSDEGLTPEDRAEIGEVLEKTIRRLDQAETQEQAVAILTQAENELRSLEDPKTMEKMRSLKQLENQIAQSENAGAETLREFAQNLSNGDLEAASESIRDIDADALSNEEQESLAEELSTAAQAISEANPELAESFRTASQALQDGNPQDAEEALAKAADELDETRLQQAQMDAAQQAAEQAGQSAQRILQAGQGQQLAQSSDTTGAQSGSSGQAQSGGNQNNSQGSGQNSTDQGASGGDSEAGRGSSEQSNLIGPEAGQNPIDGENGPGDGGERGFEPLVNPTRIGGTGSMDIYLPSSGAPGEDVTGLQNTSPGESSSSTVPYIQVFPAYSEAYRRVMDSGAIPTSLRNLVRDYFSHLEP